jgi:hypothetical protein
MSEGDRKDRNYHEDLDSDSMVVLKLILQKKFKIPGLDWSPGSTIYGEIFNYLMVFCRLKKESTQWS